MAEHVITPEERQRYLEQARHWPAPARARSADPAWHVVQVVSGSERIVAERLKDRGFGLYYPKLSELRQKPFSRMSRKQREAANNGFAAMETKVRPLFPGYMFVSFNLQRDPWRDIFSFAGVHGLWCNGGLPREVPDELIAGIKRAEGDDGVIPGKTPLRSLFALGEHVRIGAGPFAGHTGIVDQLPRGYDEDTAIEKLDESLTFKVLVALFGRATPVELALGQFERL